MLSSLLTTTMAYKSTKLFNLEDRKRQTGQPTTEVDIFQWKSTLLEELRKNDTFTDHLKTGATWGLPKLTNRGFTGAQAAEKAKAVDALLTKIAAYSPRCFYEVSTKGQQASTMFGPLYVTGLVSRLQALSTWITSVLRKVGIARTTRHVRSSFTD